MSGFPLYDNLIKDLPKKDLSAKQKTEFVENIKLIDDSGKELLYALVQFYYINSEPKTNDPLPFKGIKEETSSGLVNISWCLSDFPIKLRCLLHKFLVMHIKTIQEESHRKDQNSNTY